MWSLRWLLLVIDERWFFVLQSLPLIFYLQMPVLAYMTNIYVYILLYMNWLNFFPEPICNLTALNTHTLAIQILSVRNFSAFADDLINSKLGAVICTCVRIFIGVGTCVYVCVCQRTCFHFDFDHTVFQFLLATFYLQLLTLLSCRFSAVLYRSVSFIAWIVPNRIWIFFFFNNKIKVNRNHSRQRFLLFAFMGRAFANT